MRYVHRELRPDLVRRLERLAFVADTKDLEAKYRDAVAWFRTAIQEVDEKGVRRLVSGPSK